VLAAAGAIGFIGNEIAAYIRLRAGRRLNSPPSSRTATTPARTVSSASASSSARSLVALGAEIADPLIGLAITLVILRITWHSWRTVRAG